jgi:hypothetical protein
MVSRLYSLPKSDDKYWEHAETNQHVISDKPVCDHYFVRKTGNQAECRKCRIGYYLTPGFKVKDGHIYQNKELVI